METTEKVLEIEAGLLDELKKRDTVDVSDQGLGSRSRESHAGVQKPVIQARKTSSKADKCDTFRGRNHPP